MTLALSSAALVLEHVAKNTDDYPSNFFWYIKLSFGHKCPDETQNTTADLKDNDFFQYSCP